MNPKVENTMDLTPRQIVEELDKYIIGQDQAKKIVAIALRNRLRRRRLSPGLQEEVYSKNIIMMGPTGVGKTEIARRLSRLTNAPFIKVEATKFTEVVYVGRDVESIIRDLVDIAINIVRAVKTQEVRERAVKMARERILDIMCEDDEDSEFEDFDEQPRSRSRQRANSASRRLRRKLEKKLDEGLLEDMEIDIEPEDSSPPFDPFNGGGLSMDDMQAHLRHLLDQLGPDGTSMKRLPVRDAREILIKEEINNLIDKDNLHREAIRLTEQSGLVFIDEIDKIAGRESPGASPNVSREGVQRDLLPIVEGCTVSTRYGAVSTDHILFIAAGAFHMTSPSDLIPELQGRFPLRVELNALGIEEYRKILSEPQNSLTLQYKALLATDGVNLDFTPDGIYEIARAAYEVNQRSENIGARRLYTIMEKLLEDVSFTAPEEPGKCVTINAEFVCDTISGIVQDQDLSRFVL